ncbi:hypothetical protein PINS_up009112 [Pythium insidiosum]|nr:hypothetical protein PINS_up009112 [Pythium insidiosum]
MSAAPKPWGRFKLVSKEPATESDHLYFVQSVNRIGRNPARCNILLDMLFVSGIHCVVTLKGKNERGDPIVMLEDMSRNGIYLNEELVGKGNSATLTPNITIHFTRPGLQAKAVPPTVYKFEILKTGLTAENDRLRADSDRLASTGSRPSSVSGASSTTASNASVAATQAAARAPKRGHDELEIEIERTRNLSSSVGNRTPPSAAKRRRTGDTARSDDDLLETTAQIQKANQALRLKLKESGEREAKLKQALSEVERDHASQLQKLDILEETNKSLEEELAHQKMMVAERDEELTRVRQSAESVEAELKDLRRQLDAAHAQISARMTEIVDLKEERQKIDADVASMTRHYEAAQAKLRSTEDQVRSLINEKKKLELAVDSVQTRNEQAEEGKRGVHEENIVLKTRLTSAQHVLREMQKLVARGFRVVEDETSVMSQELEDLRRQSGSSFFSSEQSQPTPVQDHFCADTQTDELEDDQAQTLDQDAAIAKAGVLPTTTSTGLGPFSRATPTLPTLPQSMSADLLESEQQPVSTDMSVDETPLGTETKSLSEGSSVSSTTKTPPARPLPREPVVSASTVEPSEGRDDETMEQNAEQKKETGNEEKQDEDEEEEESKAEVLDEEDKDNTPVMQPEAPSSPAASTTTTTTAVETPKVDAAQTPSKEKGWLQRIVTDEGDDSGDSEQASASEGGGMFDDETQLSAGDH